MQGRGRVGTPCDPCGQGCRGRYGVNRGVRLTPQPLDAQTKSNFRQSSCLSREQVRGALHPESFSTKHRAAKRKKTKKGKTQAPVQRTALASSGAAGVGQGGSTVSTTLRPDHCPAPSAPQDAPSCLRSPQFWTLLSQSAHRVWVSWRGARAPFLLAARAVHAVPWLSLPLGSPTPSQAPGGCHTALSGLPTTANTMVCVRTTGQTKWLLGAGCQ